MTGIPFSFPQVGSGQVIQGGEAPNPLQTFLQSFLAGTGQGAQNYDRAQQRSLSSAELDLRKQEMAFRMAQEKTKQETLKHQQEIAKQQGEAAQLFLGTVLPHMANTGAINAILPQPPQGGTGWTPQNNAPLPQVQQTQPSPVPNQPVNGMQPTPAATTPDDRLARFLSTMAPEAAAQFVQHDLPHLLTMRKGADEKGQAVQTGEMVTSFVPGKGFWDPQANAGKGGYVPSIERGLSKDQKDEKAIEHQIRLETLRATQAYRQDVESRALMRGFDTRTKDLRDRGRIIMQAQQTIGDALHNPDPMQRRVLYSSAIANFVQAADQKAQLRYQLLNYFKNNVDPSIGGRWNTLRDRLLSGSLPKYVSEGMLAHLGNLLTMSRSEYEKHANGEMKRHPNLVNYIPPADEFFTNDLQTPTPDTVDPSAFFSGVPQRP